MNKNRKECRMPKPLHQKQQEAKERQEQYNKLSISEKLKKLDSKLGKNKGAKKERTELMKQLKEKK